MLKASRLSLRFAPKADMPLRGSECSLWADTVEKRF
jgi:hypothetical protein